MKKVLIPLFLLVSYPVYVAIFAFIDFNTDILAGHEAAAFLAYFPILMACFVVMSYVKGRCLYIYIARYRHDAESALTIEDSPVAFHLTQLFMIWITYVVSRGILRI